MKKAAIYARVSTDEQAQGEKFSLETQLEDMTKYCQDNGLEVVAEYIDKESGTDIKRDRQQYYQMLADVHKDKFDIILCWRPDRLYRGLVPAAKLKKALDETGVDVRGVKQPIDKGTIGIWAAIGEMELDGFKQRTKAGRMGRAGKLGKWNGGFIKYGYQYNPDRLSPSYTGKLEVNPQEADVVLGLFKWVDEGKTASSWVRWANKSGIPTKKRGKAWVLPDVSHMLRDTAYVGKGYWNKVTRKRGKKVKTEEQVPFAYPVIVPEDLFDRIQEKLKRNRKFNSGGAKKYYMLQNKGKCGVCGGTLGCVTVNGHRYMFCHRQTLYPHIHSCFSPKRIPMDCCEKSIWGDVEEMLDNFRKPMLDALIGEMDGAKLQLEADIQKALKEIERCKTERQRVLHVVRKGFCSDKEVDIQFRAIREDEERWESELSAAQESLNNISSVTDAIVNQIAKVVSTVETWWDVAYPLTEKQKREIVNTLLDSFILHPDNTIELRMRAPLTEAEVAEKLNTLLGHGMPCPYIFVSFASFG
jgi:DNA invertase Pin-like site-specific DNA recombinase